MNSSFMRKLRTLEYYRPVQAPAPQKTTNPEFQVKLPFHLVKFEKLHELGNGLGLAIDACYLSWLSLHTTLEEKPPGSGAEEVNRLRRKIKTKCACMTISRGLRLAANFNFTFVLRAGTWPM